MKSESKIQEAFRPVRKKEKCNGNEKEPTGFRRGSMPRTGCTGGVKTRGEQKNWKGCSHSQRGVICLFKRRGKG